MMFQMPQPPYVQPEYSPILNDRISAMAITSLVCGLLLCIPGVTGLAAIAFGIAGLVVTAKPSVRGRGLATAGLVLGIINLAAWGFGAFSFFELTSPVRSMARQFVRDLSQGNAVAANADCTNPLGETEVQAGLDWFKARAPVQTVRITSVSIEDDNGFQTGAVNCTIHFSDGAVAYGEIHFIVTSGIWRVTRFQFH